MPSGTPNRIGRAFTGQAARSPQVRDTTREDQTRMSGGIASPFRRRLPSGARPA